MVLYALIKDENWASFREQLRLRKVTEPSRLSEPTSKSPAGAGADHHEESRAHKIFGSQGPDVRASKLKSESMCQN